MARQLTSRLGRTSLLNMPPCNPSGYLWCSWTLVWATAVPEGAGHPGRAELLVSSSDSRISEAAQRYWEARSEALLDGDSRAVCREAAGADLMLAYEAAELPMRAEILA